MANVKAGLIPPQGNRSRFFFATEGSERKKNTEKIFIQSGSSDSLGLLMAEDVEKRSENIDVSVSSI